MLLMSVVVPMLLSRMTLHALSQCILKLLLRGNYCVSQHMFVPTFAHKTPMTHLLWTLQALMAYVPTPHASAPAAANSSSRLYSMVINRLLLML